MFNGDKAWIYRLQISLQAERLKIRQLHKQIDHLQQTEKEKLQKLKEKMEKEKKDMEQRNQKEKVKKSFWNNLLLVS